MTAINDNEIQERLVALTRDLILIPSIPSRREDRQRCYEFIRNHLESVEGIEIREYEHNGSPSLVAFPSGCERPGILMCGHIDVITHPVEAYRSRISEGKIFGPGAGDMKGAVAILLEIFRHIHSAAKGASLALAITADEEVGGEAGIGYLFGQKGLRCDEAMIPDGGSLTQITVEEKGILHLKLVCRGHSAHAARPWLGDNPIEKLMTVLKNVQERFASFQKKEDHWHPTCAVSIISTENQTVNRIPTEASAVLDIRFPAPHSVEEMTNIVKESSRSLAETEVIISAEPTNLSPDSLYVEVTREITGEKPALVKDDGGSDARFIAACGIPVVMSRPVVGELHSAEEWIDINSMVKLYRIYERYICRKLEIS